MAEAVMKTILPFISRSMADPEIRFIFPSQVAADFWRKKLLESGAVRAVRWERFQSWDSFKEDLFALSQSEMPVNSRIRRIFAADLIKRFIRGEVDFNYLLNPDFKDTAGIFQGYLSKLLPHLKSFLELVGDGTGEFDPVYLSDIELLNNEYLKFMRSSNLFEPSWLTPVMGGEKGTWIIFFPELIEDWDELASQLENSPSVKIVPLRDELLHSKAPRLHSYNTSRHEIEDFCLQAGTLLDRGVTDIAVTLADTELLPLFQESAVLYNIPLNLHLGSSLGETPEGMFFSRLRDCRDENFSLRSMKALLLNGAYPWRDGELIRALICFGAETYCLRNIDSSREGDLWYRMLSLGRGKEVRAQELLKFYSDLKSSILGLTSASGFSDFSRFLEVFLNRFMNTDNWEAGGLAVFQRCRRSIAELKLLEDKFAGLELPPPLDFLVQDLGGITYVVQRAGGGIPVYAYRVSAGMVPEHHFILGLSHSASRILLPPFPFLREDQRTGLNLDEKDFSDDFIRAYLSSGENVSLSCSEQTPGGPKLPAGFFVVHDLITPAGKRGVRDPFLAELDFWRGQSGELPALFSPVQKNGAASGVNGFYQRDHDMNNQPLEPENFRSEALAPLRRGSTPSLSDDSSTGGSGEPGSGAPFRLSPYRLDGWASCPLKYYLQYGLGLGEIPYEAEWSNAMALGNLRHEILCRFFKTLGYRKFDPSAGEEYRELMEKASTGIFGEWEKREPLASTPFWFVFKSQILCEVLSFLEGERKQYPGFGVLELESLHELRIGDIHLSGRIDRVSEKEGVLGIVDYKSSVYQSLTGMFDSEGYPFSFQMPVYILLLRAEERRIESAAYFDMKKGRYVSMLDPQKPLSAELMENALGILTEELLRFQDEASAGTFFPNEECRPCDFRFICRTKYIIREASNG